ncbi:NAD(P)H-binding protein [Paenibacillus sp. HJL G12]|uniref:NAD(P)H-binding protein n=1 Tax=Paenibacillus dendrobii TaxID=2691084 RepID=A0A7X3LHS7_9BACL|nr:NAD(P)H-binding protein [Paenibacillus dendrobii]MWV43868.1 NAD(P)H-binding protein [Paenibacillus dendrobii]
MTIVITGASGKLGSLIIKQLLQKGSPGPIAACVRHPEIAKPYHDLGIEVRICDYDQVESLETAFAGASKLLFISSSHPDDTTRLRQHAHVIEAAKRAKVEHLLYTSFAFPEAGSTSLTHLHLATEHAIHTTGIPFTFLRNALYTDFVGALGLDAAVSAGELLIPPGDWLFNSVARDDLALGIATVLLEEGHQNTIYELTSPHAWSFHELTHALSAIAGKPISLRQDIQVQHWLYGFLRKIDTSSTSPDLEKLIGGPMTPLKDSLQSWIISNNH